MRLIEGQARQILFRGLNGRNLVAFVGSGVSAAYGRLTWFKWQELQLGGIDELAKAFCKLCESVEVQIKRTQNLTKPSSWPSEFGSSEGLDALAEWLSESLATIKQARAEIGTLHETFKRTKSDIGSFPGGEALPIKFEIAGQLHDRLRVLRELFLEAGPTPRAENLSVPWCGIRAVEATGAPPMAKTLSEKLSAAGQLSTSGEGEWPKAWPDDWPEHSAQSGSFRRDFDAYSHLATRPEADWPFQRVVKALLVDERSHAEQLLLRGFGTGPREGRRDGFGETVSKLRERVDVIATDNLVRGIPGLREKPDLYRVLAPFKLGTAIKTLDETLAGIAPCWQWILAEWIKHFEERSKALGTGGFVSPTERFIVASAIALQEGIPELVEDENWPAEPERSDFRGRRWLIDPKLDPLDCLVDRLGIHRFLTTNYDFEIERYYVDRGYRDFTEATSRVAEGTPAWRIDDFRHDGAGGFLRDITLTADDATELVSFATATDGADASVVHLHGRAAEADDLVVSERNYMDLYVREDESRTTVNEAIRLAFSASPLLFVGLAMGESDLLRPLRQFMSNRDGDLGYAAVVLLPGDKGPDERAKTAAALYLRYGVHTLFHGDAHLPGASDGPIDWLSCITLVISKLRGWVEAEREWIFRRVKDEGSSSDKPSDAGKKESSDAGKEERRINKKRLTRSIIEALDEALEGHSAQRVTLGKLTGQGDNLRTDNLSDAALALPRFAMTGAKPPNKPDERLKLPLQTLSALIRLTDTERHSVLPDEKRRLRDLNARLIALDGVQGAVLTASTTIAIESIEQGWQTWWDEWRAPPEREPRAAVFETLVGPPAYVLDKKRREKAMKELREKAGKAGLLIPRRLLRHRVELSESDDRLQAIASAPGAGSWDGETGHSGFDGFIQAVLAERRSRSRPDTCLGRRLYTVAAPRGHGKGSFLSILSTPLGLSAYAHAAHGEGTKYDAAMLVAGLFVNLSFSSEIGSVLDMVRDAVLDVTSRLDALVKEDLGGQSSLDGNAAWSQLQGAVLSTENVGIAGKPPGQAEALERLPRRQELRQVMKSFSGASLRFSQAFPKGRRRHPRLLLALAPVDVLFDGTGQPKNGEIGDVLHDLMGKISADMPLDIIACGDDSRFGGPFTASYPERRLIVRPGIAGEPKSETAIRVKLDRSSLRLPSHDLERAVRGQPHAVAPKDAHLVHFLRPTNVVNLLVRDFSDLAKALALQDDSSLKENTIQDVLLNHFSRPAHKNRWREIRQVLGNNRFALTLLLAAATELFELSGRDATTRSAREANDFIEQTVNRLRNISERKREGILLQMVLGVYRRHDVADDPQRDADLHERLLRALAVIHAPVSAAVLAELPAISAHMHVRMDRTMSRPDLVTKALEALVKRRLVFQLRAPNKTEVCALKGDEQAPCSRRPLGGH